MSEVVLAWHEVSLGACCGVTRRIRSMVKERTERFEPTQGDAWGRDINGACAELAVAKMRGVYWGGEVDTFAPIDVGGWQVKHTERANGSLVVPADAPDGVVFCLVTGFPPVLNVRGYKLAREAKQTRFWRADVPRPAFFVPQSELDE
jgi:hypothetical protein